MYDQTQYTSLWMVDKNGVWINDECYFGMKKISGYAPEVWITYTQNKPVSFFFGAYDQDALDEEARIGFLNFTDPKFLKEFEGAVQDSYIKAKTLSQTYFEKFYKDEKNVLQNNPKEVADFLAHIRQTTSFIMSYYFLTQPQRFYKFDEEIKSYLPNKDLELISTTGRHLTYVAKITNEIVNLAKEIHDKKSTYDEYVTNHPQRHAEIKEVVDKLGFLNWGLLGGGLIDEEYVKNEIENLTSDEKKLADEVKKMSDLVSQIESRNIILETNKSKEAKMADIMGYSSVLRFDLQTCMLCIVKYADNFIKLAQEKYSLTSDEIASYHYDEILELIRDGKKQDNEVLMERQSGFLTVWTQKETKNYIAEDAHEQIKELLEFRANEIKTTQEVKGSVASWPDKNQPKIVGKAFVLTSAFDSEEELTKFQDGDILIATQTHPNLVPQMKKAIAIVTDEGGITCHAAIVSRELGKPCIIGTKLSSKIFKSGDLIELDLKNGTVKKSE